MLCNLPYHWLPVGGSRCVVLCNLHYDWLPVESLSVCCVTGQWLVRRRMMWRCWCWSRRQPPRSSWTSPPAPPSWGECSSTSWGPLSAASSYAGASLSSVSLCVRVCVTLWTSLSGTFLQTLPDLVTPLKGHSLSLLSCPPMRSAPSKMFGY